MSIVRNIDLFESGQQKIDWVKAHMPVLRSIEKDFKETKPFAGKKVALSIHLEAKTAYLCTCNRWCRNVRYRLQSTLNTG